MIQELDFLIRMIAIGSSLMLIAMFVSGDMRGSIKVPLLGMVIGSIFYLINATPLMMAESLFDPVIGLFAISVPYWVWLFARRLFEREPDQRILIGAAAVLVLAWLLNNLLLFTRPAGFYIVHLIGLALIADLVRVGVLEREDDLVEERRVIRLWLPLLVAAQAGSVLLFELYEAISGSEGQYPLVTLINSFLILVLILFAGVTLLRTNRELLNETPTVNHEILQAPTPELSPTETVLHEKLMSAINEGAYRESGLTIARLAAQLDTPEHRLRALINQKLGYRNFSAFLNRHRITEARKKLSNRDEVDLPVLTIAMDLGYNSLPTFNRAFRSETGTTPSDFRRLAINEESEAAAEPTVQN